MATSVMVFHPHMERSHANRALMDAAAQVPGTVVRDMYAQYPDFRIDVARERAIAADADLIVFQFPLYWYSAPALLKEWEDAVFEVDGSSLEGKRMLLAVTAGGKLEDYAEDGKQGATMAQVLRPYRMTANYLGMRFEDPLLLHHAHHIADDELVAVAGRYADLLR